MEDDRCVAQELGEALTTQHYLVDIANDGQTAWELAEAIEYDLILLDLMLPGMDGISFCKRRRQEGDRTPILLLTAQDTIASKVMALDAGADDYIVKPFNLDELLQAQQQAHTLIGSLGSFGFAEASHLCREIEQIFQAEAKLPQIQIQHLQNLIVALRQELAFSQYNGGVMSSCTQ